MLFGPADEPFHRSCLTPKSEVRRVIGNRKKQKSESSSLVTWNSGAPRVVFKAFSVGPDDFLEKAPNFESFWKKNALEKVFPSATTSQTKKEEPFYLYDCRGKLTPFPNAPNGQDSATTIGQRLNVRV